MRLGVAVLLCATACTSARPELPRMLSFEGLHAHRRGEVSLAGVAVRAVYVLPRERSGIGSEDAAVEVIDLVAVLGGDGALYLDDASSARGAFRYQKLAAGEVRARSPQGAVSGDLRFTPSEDVRAAVDSGYQIEVEVASRVSRLVFPPLYETERYRPFERTGGTPPAGEPGGSPGGPFTVARFDGKDGADGEPAPSSDGPDGEPGEDGKDGKDAGESGGDGGDGGDGADARAPGERPGNGGRGGHGGAGAPGDRGGDGGPGARGGDGPHLEITARPIRSKWYPDEELVFVEIVPSGGAPKSYVLHQGATPLAVRTVGGRGGAGGSGGRGGHGGDGGDGGKGGRGGSAPAGQEGGKGGDGGRGGSGARGGDGGDGGRGGDGGDGGTFALRVSGGPGFAREVARLVVVQSIPGEGGPGGPPGDGGAGGRGGAGGDGGRGSSDGAKGTRGRDAEAGHDGPAGAAGVAGTAR